MASVQQAQVIPSLNLDGRIITDLTNLICLVGVVNGATLVNSSMRVPLGTSGRAVTSGKTFRVVAVSIMVSVAGSAILGYCDNDVGMGTGTAQTNPVYVGNSGMGAIGGAVNTLVTRAIQYDVPAGKYLSCSNGGGVTVGNIYIYGYEF